MLLRGKVAVVTGGARRVGRAIALALARRGCHVAVNYRTSGKAARATVRELGRQGVKAVAVRADVSKRREVERMAASVRERLGPVSILINNASIFERTPWPAVSEREWDRHLEINLKGPFLCARAFASSMRRRREGKIINLVDGAGRHPYAAYVPYCVSKAGLICLTKALAKALAPHVQVCGVAPGPVLFPEGTSAEEKARALRPVPLGRAGSPEDVAAAVLFLLEGTDYATGSVVHVDGGRFME